MGSPEAVGAANPNLRSADLDLEPDLDRNSKFDIEPRPKAEGIDCRMSLQVAVTSELEPEVEVDAWLLSELGQLEPDPLELDRYRMSDSEKRSMAPSICYIQ
jgi:hypothetical protein